MRGGDVTAVPCGGGGGGAPLSAGHGEARHEHGAVAVHVDVHDTVVGPEGMRLRAPTARGAQPQVVDAAAGMDHIVIAVQLPDVALPEKFRSFLPAKEALLDAGADPNARDAAGSLPRVSLGRACSGPAELSPRRNGRAGPLSRLRAVRAIGRARLCVEMRPSEMWSGKAGPCSVRALSS